MLVSSPVHVKTCTSTEKWISDIQLVFRNRKCLDRGLISQGKDKISMDITSFLFMGAASYHLALTCKKIISLTLLLNKLY